MVSIYHSALDHRDYQRFSHLKKKVDVLDMRGEKHAMVELSMTGFAGIQFLKGHLILNKKRSNSIMT